MVGLVDLANACFGVGLVVVVWACLRVCAWVWMCWICVLVALVVFGFSGSLVFWVVCLGVTGLSEMVFAFGCSDGVVFWRLFL